MCFKEEKITRNNHIRRIQHINESWNGITLRGGNALREWTQLDFQEEPLIIVQIVIKEW